MYVAGSKFDISGTVCCGNGAKGTLVIRWLIAFAPPSRSVTYPAEKSATGPLLCCCSSVMANAAF